MQEGTEVPYRDRRRIQQYWHEVLTGLENEPDPAKKADIASHLMGFTGRLRLEMLKVRNVGIAEMKDAGMTPFQIGRRIGLSKTQVQEILRKPLEPYADVRDEPDMVIDISYMKPHLEDEEEVL